MPRAAAVDKPNRRGGPASRQSRKQGHARSRKGCSECRKRKIKCDEAHPQCGQCRRAGRACPILDSLFRPHALTFSVSSTGTAGETQQTDSSEALTAEARPVTNQQTSPIDRNVHSSHRPAVSIPTANEPSPHVTVPITPEHAASATATAPVSHPATEASIQNSSPNVTLDCQFANVIPTPVWPESVPLAQAHIAAPNHVPHNDHASEDDEDADEIAFFLRQFSEGIGAAMDLVTTDGYFSRQAVMLASRCPLIRYAACAAAAKQIGQMDECEPRTRLTDGQMRVMDAIRETGLDYLWYGAKYYGKAIQALAREISQEDPSPSANLRSSSLVPSPSAIYGAVAAVSGPMLEAEMGQDSMPAVRLVAACILCQYEDLSATMRAYSGHLDGICKLLQIDGRDETLRTSHPRPYQSAAHQSVFWWFVLNDFKESFVSQRHTRVDTEDLPLWRSMGLHLDEAGFPQTEPPTPSDPRVHFSTEHMALRALLRLLCKVVNCKHDTTASSPLDPAAHEARWTQTARALDAWLEHAPPSFRHPASVLQRKAEGQQAAPPLSDVFAGEAWFGGGGAGAFAMAHYHTARTVLLLCGPIGGAPRSNAELMAAARALQRELRGHTAALFAIALGAADDGLRIHLLQPLCAAAQCLTDGADRGAAVGMIRGLERELGVMAEDRVKDLVEGWGAVYSEEDVFC